MDKYNIIIGILLLMIIFDNKMVEGLTMEVCDVHENKFKKLEEKINSMGGSGKSVVINNHACNNNKGDDGDDDDDDDDDSDNYKKDEKNVYEDEKSNKLTTAILFDYIPKILIGILLLILLYYLIDYFFLKNDTLKKMTYDQALEEVKNAKVLESKGIKLK
jgi:hypothetical protein